jgi:hypothetical protein
MPLTLGGGEDGAAKYIIKQILAPNWSPSNTVGFDPNVSLGDGAFLPFAPNLDLVGAPYPSLTVTRSNETSGGASTYDYLTTSGPGQTRNGSLVITASAEVRDDDYVGDSQSYSTRSADELVTLLRQEVERICSNNPTGGSTDIAAIGAFPAGDTPDQRAPGEGSVVRTDATTITYAWPRD